MEQLVFLAPFIPFLAMLPPSVAAVWIAHRLIRARGAAARHHAEITALRDEVTALRRALVETQERIEFTERVLAGLRDPRRPVPTKS